MGNSFLIVSPRLSQKYTVKACKTLEAFFPLKFLPHQSNTQEAVASSLFLLTHVQGTYLSRKDQCLHYNLKGFLFAALNHLQSSLYVHKG